MQLEKFWSTPAVSRIIDSTHTQQQLFSSFWYCRITINNLYARREVEFLNYAKRHKKECSDIGKAYHDDGEATSDKTIWSESIISS